MVLEVSIHPNTHISLRLNILLLNCYCLKPIVLGICFLILVKLGQVFIAVHTSLLINSCYKNYTFLTELLYIIDITMKKLNNKKSKVNLVLFHAKGRRRLFLSDVLSDIRGAVRYCDSLYIFVTNWKRAG
jgi:hypothetical protein